MYICNDICSAIKFVQILFYLQLITTKFNEVLRKANSAFENIIQRAVELFFWGLEWPERQAYQSPPSSAEVGFTWSHGSTPSLRLHGVVLN
jgi:hypothetical protein